MTVAIMQPYLFPYIGYIQLIKAVDTFILLDDVNYINKGFINRNSLKDGKFTVPIQGASQNKLINELEWVPGSLLNLCDRLLHNYHGCDNWNEVNDAVISKLNSKKVLTTIFVTLDLICVHLGINTHFRLASAFGKNGKGQDRIIDLCHQMGADTYVNPEGGKKLYDSGDFANAGIDLKFLNCECNDRSSIIDLLMRYNKNELNDLLNQYKLTNE